MKENIVGAVIELAFTTATYRSRMAHMHAEHAEKMEQHRLLRVRSDMEHQRHMADIAINSATTLATLQAAHQRDHAVLKLSMDHGLALSDNYLFDNGLLHLF